MKKPYDSKRNSNNQLLVIVRSSQTDIDLHVTESGKNEGLFCGTGVCDE